jgi:hypothetical protein
VGGGWHREDLVAAAARCGERRRRGSGEERHNKLPRYYREPPRVSVDLPKPKGIGLVWGTMLRSHAYIPYFFLY